MTAIVSPYHQLLRGIALESLELQKVPMHCRLGVGVWLLVDGALPVKCE